MRGSVWEDSQETLDFEEGQRCVAGLNECGNDCLAKPRKGQWTCPHFEDQWRMMMMGWRQDLPIP